MVRGRRRWGFEIKRTVAPKMTRSMQVALKDLRLHSISVIHAGDDTFPLGKKIHAIALAQLTEELEPLLQ